MKVYVIYMWIDNLFPVISVISFAAWTAFQHQHLSETFHQEPFLHSVKIGPIPVVNDVYNVKHNKWQNHPGAHISAGVREGKVKEALYDISTVGNGPQR